MQGDAQGDAQGKVSMKVAPETVQLAKSGLLSIEWLMQSNCENY